MVYPWIYMDIHGKSFDVYPWYIRGISMDIPGLRVGYSWLSETRFCGRPRLYHELAKVVQSADKIFELLYLKNFVES
jgi:hypothetical protein